MSSLRCQRRTSYTLEDSYISTERKLENYSKITIAAFDLYAVNDTENILTIKTVVELRNVSDAAYAMSHAAAKACTARTAAGCRAWH